MEGMARSEEDMHYAGEGDTPTIGVKVVKCDIAPKHFDIETERFTDEEKEKELARSLSGVDGENPDSKWFGRIEPLIEKGEKRAWYYPSVKKVLFVVGPAAIAVEVGRRGKDIRHLIKLANQIRKDVQKQKEE